MRCPKCTLEIEATALLCTRGRGEPTPADLEAVALFAVALHQREACPAARGEARAVEARRLGARNVAAFVDDLEAKGSIYDAATIATGRWLLERYADAEEREAIS